MIKLLTKLGLGAAVAATTLTAAAPADAQYYRGGYRYHDRGIGAGGAAVLGGLLGLGVGAAIASNNNRYYDRGYYDDAPPPPRPYYRGYYDRGYDDAPRCWSQWRYDPYWGRDVRVRVCR